MPRRRKHNLPRKMRLGANSHPFDGKGKSAISPKEKIEIEQAFLLLQEKRFALRAKKEKRQKDFIRAENNRRYQAARKLTQQGPQPDLSTLLKEITPQ